MSTRKPSSIATKIVATFAIAALSLSAFAGRYWLGGDGYWLDKAKWASDSSSTTGGANVPDSSGGTVYFNNSGSLVFNAGGNIGSSDVKINSGTSSEPVMWSASEPSYGLTTTGKIRVGADSTPGALTIESGTYSAAAVYVPRKEASGAYGRFVFNGGKLTVSDSCFVGYKAGTEGEFVLNGGDIIVNKDVFYLGEGGTGRFTMNDGTFTMQDSGYGFCICHDTDGSVAEVTLNGGVLTTPKFRIDKLGSTENGTIVFNGGTLKATRNQDDYIATNPNLSCVLQSGGLVVDTASYNVGIAHEFTGSGPLIKKGAGTLTVADASKFTEVIVYEGTAIVGGTTYTQNAGPIGIDVSAGGDLGTIVLHGAKLEGWLKDAGFMTNYSSEYGANGTASLERPTVLKVYNGDDEAEYTNLETGKAYTKTLGGEEFTFTTEDLAPRTFRIDTPSGTPADNVRDVGSWPLMGGRKMNQGVILRGGHLDGFVSATAEQRSASYLTAIGLKTEIDLRKVGLDTEMPTEYQNLDPNGADNSFAADNCKYYRFGLGWGENEGTMIGADNNGTFTNQMRNVFSTLGSEGRLPAYFHCRIGTDRTGITGLLLLGLMGVEEEVLYRDYLMSNFANIGGSRSSAIPEKFIRYILRGNCNDGKYVYNTKDAQYGVSVASRCRQYLQMCGVTDEEIGRITAALSGETPDEVLARVNAWEQEQNVRTVTYVPYAGSTDVAGQHRLPAGENILPLAEPTRAGYIFKGWDAENEDNGTVYALWEAEAPPERKLKWDNNAGDCRLANVGNWLVYTVGKNENGDEIEIDSDPQEHSLPTILEDVKIADDTQTYAALNADETFNAKSLYVGRGWHSTVPAVVDVTNGTFTVAETVTLGRYGGSAEFNVFGGEVTLKQMLVGHWGSHTDNAWTIHGGTVSVLGGSWPGAVSIGNQDKNAVGVMTVAGGTVNIGGAPGDQNALIVGFSDLQTPGADLCSKLLVTGGETTVTDGSIYVAHAAGAGGFLSVSNGTLSATGGLVLGDESGAWAQVEVKTGGRVSLGGDVKIGDNAGVRQAVLTVAGGELEAGTVYVGNRGSGTLSVTDGGVVRAKQIQRAQNAPAAGSYRLFMDGGTIVVGQDTGLFLASLNSVTFGERGGVIDTDGHNVTLEACYGFDGTGSFTKTGAGTLTIKYSSYGIDCAYTAHGRIIVKKGTLKLPSNQTIYCEGVEVADGASLDPNGSEIIIVDKEFNGARWTNAAGDGDPSNPLNWRAAFRYFNQSVSFEETVAGLVPSADTPIIVPYVSDVPSFDGFSDVTWVVEKNMGIEGFFRPDVLKTAAVWYDPSDEDTLTSEGDFVVGIKNKGTLKADDEAGVDLDLELRVPANNQKSKLSDEGFNGRKSIAFNGGPGYRSRGFFPAAFTANSPRTLFVVAQGAVSQMIMLSIAKKENGDDEGRSMLIAHSANDWSQSYQVGYWADGWHQGRRHFSALQDNTPYVFAGRTALPEEGGVAISAFAIDPAGANHAAAGSQAFGSLTEPGTARYTAYYGAFEINNDTSFWVNCGSNGYQGEALIFTNALSDAEVEAVNDYLKGKWLDSNALPEVDSLVVNALVDLDGTTRTFRKLSGGGAFLDGTVVLTGDLVVTVNPDRTVVAPRFDRLQLGPNARLVINGVKNLSDRHAIDVLSFAACEGRFASVVGDRNTQVILRYADTSVHARRDPGFRVIMR